MTNKKKKKIIETRLEIEQEKLQFVDKPFEVVKVNKKKLREVQNVFNDAHSLLQSWSEKYSQALEETAAETTLTQASESRPIQSVPTVQLTGGDRPVVQAPSVNVPTSTGGRSTTVTDRQVTVQQPTQV